MQRSRWMDVRCRTFLTICSHPDAFGGTDATTAILPSPSCDSPRLTLTGVAVTTMPYRISHLCCVSFVVLVLIFLAPSAAAKNKHKIKINAPATSPPHTARAATNNNGSPATPASDNTPSHTITFSHPPQPPSLPPSHPDADSLLSLATSCYVHVSEVGGPVITTTVCPFHNITQHIDTSPLSYYSLGVWSQWSSPSQPHELVQQFEDGDQCGKDGEMRSAVLRVRCHDNATVTAVVELRRCRYTAVLYSPAVCPHLPPSQPIAAEVRSGRGDEPAAAVQHEEVLDVGAMQACIDELSEATENERNTVACAVRWNEVRATLDGGSPLHTDEAVEEHRLVYPYKHKQTQKRAIRRTKT